jgi:hypothetical protein
MPKQAPFSTAVMALAATLAGLTAAAAARAADQRLLVRGQINGRAATFALDTGTSFAVAVPERHLSKFGLRIDRPVQSEIVKGFTNPATIRLPPNFTAKDVVLAVPFSGPAEIEWEFDGLVGWEAMRGMPLLFRQQGKQAVLGGPVKIGAGATAFPMIPSNVAMFDADSGAAEVPAMIDTGWSGGVRLAPALWAQWRSKNRRANTVMTEFSPNHGLVVVDQVFASDFELAGLRLRNVMVSEMPASKAGGKQDPKVVLGLDAFANHELMIDGPAGKVMIGKPEPTAAKPDYNRLGATFVPDRMAARVAPGSPAATADIRDGDILVAIDGMTPQDYASRLRERSVWEQPAGTRVTLTLERAGSQITRQVTLRDFIEP